jgi:transposase
LQAELARKDIESAANAAEIHAKTLHIEKLKMQLAVLRRGPVRHRDQRSRTGA